MYGIFTYIWFKFMVNVGKYTIHGSYGVVKLNFIHKQALVRAGCAQGTCASFRSRKTPNHKNIGLEKQTPHLEQLHP